MEDFRMHYEPDTPKAEQSPGPFGPTTPPRPSEGQNDSKMTASNASGKGDAFIRNEERYRSLLDAYDALLELNTLQGTNLNLDVKQICVMGYQSVGKSTYLEALANRHISLPRGTDMVTKSPIRLTLRDKAKFMCKIQDKDITSRFQHLSPSARGDLITTEYELALREMGVAEGKKCTSKEVRLEVHAPGIPNLSLLDLPGAPPEVHKDQLSTVIELHQKFADDKNCLVVVLDSNQQGDNSYVENKADSVLKKAIADQRLLCVYNIQSGTTELSALCTKMRKRHDEGHSIFAVRLESFDERQSGATDTAHEAEQLYRQEIANGKMKLGTENSDNATRQWFAQRLGIDYCQNWLAKKQRDLVIESMKSGGLLTKVENLLELEEAAIKKVQDETCIDKTAAEKLRDIDSYAQEIHSIVEKAIVSGVLPELTLLGSSNRFTDIPDPQYELYAIIPKVYEAEKAFLHDAKLAAVKFITGPAKGELAKAFNQQSGFASDAVSQHRTILSVTLKRAYDELHVLALAHIDHVNKIVEEAVHNMIYCSHASNNAVPEHLPNLVKHFKSAVDEFFYLKKKDAIIQCQALISCLTGTMRWDQQQISSATPGIAQRFAEALKVQKKLLFALFKQKNKHGSQRSLTNQPSQNQHNQPIPPVDTGRPGNQEGSSKANGPAIQAGQSPTPLAPDTGEDSAFDALMHEALTLLIDVQEKFSDMLLRTARMIQIHSVHMNYLAQRQQESRLLEKFLKEKTDNNEKALEKAFEIPPEHKEGLDRRRKVVRCCKEFKSHFSNLNNSV